MKKELEFEKLKKASTLLSWLNLCLIIFGYTLIYMFLSLFGTLIANIGLIIFYIFNTYLLLKTTFNTIKLGRNLNKYHIMSYIGFWTGIGYSILMLIAFIYGFIIGLGL